MTTPRRAVGAFKRSVGINLHFAPQLSCDGADEVEFCVRLRGQTMRRSGSRGDGDIRPSACDPADGDAGGGGGQEWCGEQRKKI